MTGRREYRTRDKSDWGPGPWQDEPDKVQYKDAATGLPCLIVRNNLGALCGYVGVTEGHPYFGKDYSAAGPADLAVHGGITFGEFCRKSPSEDDGICHVPEPGEPDRVFWFGFDCAHAFDLVPQMRAHERRWVADGIIPHREEYPEAYRDVYRDLQYVENEIASLARQLAEAAK